MTSFRASSLLLAVGGLWLILAGLAGTPRVHFLHPPHLVSDRATITYIVRVPRHAANRALIVAAVAEDGVVSEARRQLEGAEAPVLYNFAWRLPEGRLSLVAALIDTSGRSVDRAVHPLTVYPSR